MSELKIGAIRVGTDYPTVTIAEVGSNHGGSLDRAKHLCLLAKSAGADCAKFQHYRADKLASQTGFEGLNLAHYTDNPYDVFKKYEVPWEWTPELKAYCDSIGIEFMSTPYDLEAVNHLEPYVNAYKIGSGDITYHELIRYAAMKRKPLLISTGASSKAEVQSALEALPDDYDWGLGLLHCNTNYSGRENDSSLNLRVLEDWKGYINCVTGLSDHNTDLLIPAVAVALGARIIERHFTDNRHTNKAPDSPFAMDPVDFKLMVEQVRAVERMLGDGVKKVEENEKETVVLQRRSIMAAKLLRAGTAIRAEHLAFLRPAPADGLPPYRKDEILDKVLRRDIQEGEVICGRDLR